MTSAHPIIITSSLLASVSVYLGTHSRIPLGTYFQDLYPNVWMLSVADSGQHKTTALNLGARVVLQQAKEVAGKIKEFSDKLRLETNKTKQAQIEEDSLQEQAKSLLFAQRTTAEALLQDLARGQRGVIYTSEFGALLQNLNKSHNSDFKGILTELYDVPEIYSNRTKNQGNNIIARPFHSICGVTTSAWLKDNLKPNDVDSGFFARFMLFTPPHDDTIAPAWPKQQIITQAFIEIENKIRSICEETNNSYINYTISPKLPSFIKEIYLGIIHKVNSAYDGPSKKILEPYVKRWPAHVLKLAMIIQPFVNPKSTEISLKAMN